MVRGLRSRQNSLPSTPHARTVARLVHALLCMLLCASWCHSRTTQAQTHSAAADTPEQLLEKARTALTRARFDDAEQLLADLATRPLLTARERNEALELTAIVAIAERKESRAKETLRLLLRRDPAHTRRITDLGPSVDAAFARAQQARETSIEVALSSRLARDAAQRPVLHVKVGEGLDAVETVHVFVDTRDGGPTAHLVSPLTGTAELTFLLPGPLPGLDQLALHLEAQAPSGAVIGRQGDAATPLLLQLPPLPPVKPEATCIARPKPLRREWWVWTSVGLVLSSVVIASAVTVQ